MPRTRCAAFAPPIAHSSLRQKLYQIGAERLCAVAAAVYRHCRIARKADRVGDDLRAARAGTIASREADRPGRDIDGAAEILARAAVELEGGAGWNVAVTE